VFHLNCTERRSTESPASFRKGTAMLAVKTTSAMGIMSWCTIRRTPSIMVEGSPFPFMVNVIIGNRFAGIRKIKAAMTRAQVRARLSGCR
jgi:hypothetical protein